MPPAEEWGERFAAVLEAIYAAYGVGWSDPLGADPERRDLSEEAIWLGSVLASQLPDEPEVLGLLSLMHHLEARKPARRDGEGRYVPLDEQNTKLWRRDAIMEAETLLRAASKMRSVGRFQLEAAIQSAHAARAFGGEADWDAIVLLYEALAGLTGSPVAYLNVAAAIARRDGPAAGLVALIGVIERHPHLQRYQPYWALRADLCARLGKAEEARTSYAEAIAREGDPAVVAFLKAKQAKLTDSS